MPFSFLHISDIHFDTESTSSWISRNEILKEIQNYNLKADCIVISGDLFNRGSLSKGIISDYHSFLDQLPGHDTILAVPGNHDLDRSAQLHEEGSYNVFLTRKRIVFKAGEESKICGNEYELDDQEKKVLYGKSFYAFQSFSKDMHFKSFCEPDALDDAHNYEIQVVDLPITEKPDLKARFVLLNTAVFAGQSVRGAEFQIRQNQLKKDRQAALDECNPVRAAEIFLDMTRKQQRYENDGELIIDEEIGPGWGRISLSKEGNRILSNIQSKDAAITFFVGHHGVEYLSKETREALKIAMKACHSGIYLCGHAHQSRFLRFPIQQNSIPRDIEQAQAGVMFKDRSEFAQYGFNHISFDLANNQLTGKVTSFFTIKLASDVPHWLKEDIIEFSIPLVLYAPDASQQNTFDPAPIKNTTDYEDPVREDHRKDSHEGGPASTFNHRLSNQKQK